MPSLVATANKQVFVRMENLAVADFCAYIYRVEIEFDPEKSEENATRRELPFSKVSEFDFDTALIGEDLRED